MSEPHRNRLLYIDWLRGIAVLLMFAAHVFAAWIQPSLVMTTAYRWINVVAGYSAPLFLFLTGVGMAMAFESALARGSSRDDARRAARNRGLMIFIAAFVFRIQEHVLGGGPVANVLRVDILNCIGLSMLLCAVLAFPPTKGAFAWRAAGAAVIVALLAPYVGRIRWPEWAPWQIYSYLSDQRSWFFPLFPWLAYPFAGLFAGTVWARAGRAEGTARRVMLGTMLVGLLLVAGSWLYLGLPEPKFIAFGGRWRNLPSYTFTHIGWICVLAGVLWLVQPFFNPARFGPIRQLGRTSLLMYWVHVDLVYGHLVGEHALDIRGRLTLGQTALGLLVLTLIMLPLSWTRTRYFAAFKPAVVFERLWRDFTAQVRAAWQKKPSSAE
ncbi:MAG: DUF1624 domain-containing protein [Deltaproteobacteria bacterium]|nr:DUF1624 domain-containing protein [Deltaproteobacteria bacterium]